MLNQVTGRKGIQDGSLPYQCVISLIRVATDPTSAEQITAASPNITIVIDSEFSTTRQVGRTDKT
jgi:hypothetical protein